MDFIRELDDATAILFLVLIVILIIVFTLLLVKKTLKARDITISEKGDEGVLLISTLDKVLEEKLAKKIGRQSFTIFEIEIEGAESIKKTFGEYQFNTTIKGICNRLKGVFTSSSKIATDLKGKLRIYTIQKLNISAINDICKIIIFETKKPIKLVGPVRIDIAVNIGVARYPESGKTYKEILDNLTLALEISKREGVDKYLIYDKELGSLESEEYKYYREVRVAIERKEFMLYYQPIVNLSDGEVYGAEALLRWEHKERGVLLPNQFLKVLEQSGDINWVGFWAFEELVKQAEEMKFKTPDNKLLFSMNLSPKQLINPVLAEELRRIIKRHRISPQDFCLEIIEFAMYEVNDVAVNNINDLKKIGFKIAIDNYGLEFSTLSIIEKLPVDIIKLDKRFLDSSREKLMLSSVLDMVVKYADERKILLVAEGIEEEEFLSYLKDKGIGYGQGYYFSKPVDKKKIVNEVLLTPWKS